MNTTTEALRLIETLQEQGIKKEATTELIGFVERQRGELATKQDVNWLRWATIGGFTIISAFLLSSLTVSIYLHSDTKAEMERRFTEIENRLNRIEHRSMERHKELKELLQKK